MEKEELNQIDQASPDNLTDDIKFQDEIDSIMDDELCKTYPVIGKVVIKHPTLDDDTFIEMVYVKEFNRLLNESDLPTIKRMEILLNEKGEWTPKDEQKIEDQITKITNTRISLSEYKREINKRKSKPNKITLDKLRELNIQLTTYNTELSVILARKSQLFEGTIEKRAERSSLFAKIVRCVKKENNEPLWKSVDDLGRYRADIVRPLIFDCMRFWRGVQTPLSDDLLEMISGS